MLKKCFLDTYYCDALALLLQNEGKTNEKFPTIFNGPEKYLLKSILRILVLYDKLDSSSFPLSPDSDLSLNFLKSNGIIDEINYINGITIFDKDESYWNSKDKKLIFAKDISKHLILESKRTILSNFLIEYPMYNRPFSSNLVNIYDLEDKYERILKLHQNELMEKYFLEREGIGYSDFINYLLILLSNVEKAIYFSSKEKMCYINNYISERPSSRVLSDKIIEDIYYTVKINFSEEIVVLPDPNNLDDVLRMRENKDLKRFRKVMTGWMDAANEGNETMMKKIQKDIGKANKELKSLKKIAVFKESPLCFWINSIGGHIPYISNVITLLNTFEGIYNYTIHKKDDWLLLGK